MRTNRAPRRALRIAHDLSNVLFLAQFSRKEKLPSDSQTPVQLADAVRTSLPLLRRACGSRVRIRTKELNDQLHVRINPAAVKQILLNLVLNAVQAMARGGEVTIRAFLAERSRGRSSGPAGHHRMAVIEVADTGPGVPEKSRTEIFQPFYTTRPKARGLGLTAVQRIAERVGGSANLLGTEGGACFQISLPCQVRK